MDLRGSDNGAEEFHALLAQAKSGQSLAISRLLLLHHDRMLRRIERRLPDHMRRMGAAEDILQETLRAAAASLETFQPKADGDPAESFGRWLCRIADNRMVDVLRHEQTLKKGGREHHVSIDAHAGTSIGPLVGILLTDATTPSRIARAHEFELAVRAAMDRLYPAYREVLEMRLLLGLTTDEMSARLGRNNSAVRKLLSRAIHHLREEIGDTSQYISRQ